jgi:hypothetical protein
MRAWQGPVSDGRQDDGLDTMFVAFSPHAVRNNARSAENSPPGTPKRLSNIVQKRIAAEIASAVERTAMRR